MPRLLLALALAFFVVSCTKGKKENVEAEAPKERKVELNVNPNEEQRLQEAAEAGQQSWRLKAEDVAHAALLNRGVNCMVEQCTLVEQNDRLAKVRANTKDGEFEVLLERFVKPGGIWTATYIIVKKEGRDYRQEDLPIEIPEDMSQGGGHDHSQHEHSEHSH